MWIRTSRILVLDKKASLSLDHTSGSTPFSCLAPSTKYVKLPSSKVCPSTQISPFLITVGGTLSIPSRRLSWYATHSAPTLCQPLCSPSSDLGLNSAFTLSAVSGHSSSTRKDW